MAKVSHGWPPRWITDAPLHGTRGDHAVKFIEGLCRITKDSIGGHAGEPIRLRGWQQQVLRALLNERPGGRLLYRQALIGMPRKQGKSALGAGLGLWATFCGPEGAEVYSCAGDREQARIVFGAARRMIEMEPELAAACKVYRNVIEVPDTGAVYRVLSSEAPRQEGLSPTFVCFDEVHVQPNRDLWDVLSLASGARQEPLMVGITTAGVRTDSTGQDSLCYGLYQYGKKVASGEVVDPTFFMAWWEPKDPDEDHRDPETWREANPGFGDLVDPEDFASSVLRTPEPEFRTKRLNMWVSTASTWLPHGAWARCAVERPIPDLAEVVLGFDGSFSNDSTALVAVECGEVPHVDVVACWERPPESDPSWRVPIVDVEDAIRQACRRWQVREIVCDPFRWARTYQALEAEGLPVVEFPQSPQRMVPATQRFYEAVLNAGLTHSGDPRLARHIDNCVLKVDARGSRLAKETKNSPRKIDLAVSAVMAFDRASEQPPEEVVPWVAWA